MGGSFKIKYERNVKQTTDLSSYNIKDIQTEIISVYDCFKAKYRGTGKKILWLWNSTKFKLIIWVFGFH